jgi:hypothetical protein
MQQSGVRDGTSLSRRPEGGKVKGDSPGPARRAVPLGGGHAEALILRDKYPSRGAQIAWLLHQHH